MCADEFGRRQLLVQCVGCTGPLAYVSVPCLRYSGARSHPGRDENDDNYYEARRPDESSYTRDAVAGRAGADIVRRTLGTMLLRRWKTIFRVVVSKRRTGKFARYNNIIIYTRYFNRLFQYREKKRKICNGFSE